MAAIYPPVPPFITRNQPDQTQTGVRDVKFGPPDERVKEAEHPICTGIGASVDAKALLQHAHTATMLMSGILATPDKRVRRVAVRKAALSSRVSLLSGTTTSSSGSSGSGSTITQESISRPRPRNPKENGGQRGKRQKPVSNAVSSKRKSSPRKGNGIIDVFAFLDKDASRSSLVPQRSKSGSSADRDDTKYAIQDDSDLDSDPRSLHSDSGISINDASSDHDSSKINGGFGKIPHNSQQHRIPGHHPTLYAERRHKPKLQPIPQHVDEDHPEYYYWPSDMRGRSVNPAVQDVETTAGPAEEQKSSGYDLLASSLCPSRDPSEASLPPLYRRFERLNHRILLQLQDEIAEMEEDLQLMDRADAAERAARHGHTAPASRRLDWQWRGNELHARRLALLGRIYLKVEQYSKRLPQFPLPPTPVSIPTP